MSDNLVQKTDGLSTILNTIWPPIAGFIGAITLIYKYYQMWLGDRSVVTYITTGVGLVLLIIAMAWVGFSRKSAGVVIQTDGREKTVRNARYSNNFKWLARVCLGLILLGGIIGGGLLIKHREELKDKFIVLIATFDGPEDVYGLRNEILEKLNVSLADSKEIVIIPIPDKITPTEGSKYAQKVGQTYLAKLVIWGWYRPTNNPNITLHIENLTSPKTLPLEKSAILTPNVALTDLESFSFQQQAGQETSALISFLVGYLQYRFQNYSDAIGNFDDALNQIQGKANLIEDNAGIYLYRANSKLFLGKYAEAIPDYNQAIDLYSSSDPSINLDPKSVAYLNRGAALDNTNQDLLALSDLNKAIGLSPDLTGAYEDRAILYIHLGKYEQAIHDANKAIIDLGVDDSADNGTKAFPYLLRADAYESMGKYELAILDLDKVVELTPDSIRAHEIRGDTYHNWGKEEQAIKEYTKAIDLGTQPVSVDSLLLSVIYSNRGSSYQTLGQYQNALADQNKAIELNPTSATAYNNRGSIYLDIKQPEKALSDLNKAIELNPNLANAYYGRGNSYGAMGQISDAITDYTKAIDLNPNYADAYNNRGLLYDSLREYVLAIVDFDKAIKIIADSAIYYYNRGNSYAKSENYDLAIVDYNQAIKLKPDFAKAYVNRGYVYNALGQYERAIEDYNEAIAINPNDAQAYANRGHTYEALDKTAEAEADFKKYYELVGK